MKVLMTRIFSSCMFWYFCGIFIFFTCIWIQFCNHLIQNWKFLFFCLIFQISWTLLFMNNPDCEKESKACLHLIWKNIITIICHYHRRYPNLIDSVITPFPQKTNWKIIFRLQVGKTLCLCWSVQNGFTDLISRFLDQCYTLNNIAKSQLLLKILEI